MTLQLEEAVDSMGDLLREYVQKQIHMGTRVESLERDFDSVPSKT